MGVETPPEEKEKPKSASTSKERVLSP